MLDQKIPAILALSILPAITPTYLSAKEVSLSPTSTISRRASMRQMGHQLALPPLLQPMGADVGELQERWSFPSDHLPIAITFEGLNIATWNVLDAEYMDWVTKKNSQGLSRSLIADEHVYLKGSKLTIRDQHVINLILETLTHPTHPRSFLALQECGKPFLEELQKRLPTHFELISSHGEAIILDKRRFELLSASERLVFPSEPKRTIQEIRVRRLEDGQTLRFINVHLPGDPAKPCRFEFGEYLKRTFDPSVTTIAMGDMNFNELEMAEAMSKAFQNESPFSIHSPYPTNISPYVFTSKAIDHFIIYSPSGSAVALNAPEQIMPELSPMVDLLQRNFSIRASS